MCTRKLHCTALRPTRTYSYVSYAATCVCARAVGAMSMMRKTMRRAEGELRGCFAKAARASLSFCCGGFSNQNTREKERFFRKRAQKRDSLALFLMQKVILRCWFPPSANLILSSQKVASFVEILSAYMVDQLVFYEVTPSYV